MSNGSTGRYGLAVAGVGLLAFLFGFVGAIDCLRPVVGRGVPAGGCVDDALLLAAGGLLFVDAGRGG